MSTHQVNVVRLGPIEKHPNADTLGITKIMGYTVIVRLSDWHEGDLGVYIEPDYVVPDDPSFAFLASKPGEPLTPRNRRIRVKRLRGVMSHGLLVGAPPGSEPGQNVIEQMGIVRYEPPEPMTTSGEDERGAPGWYPTYDLESFRRYSHVFVPGEEVYVSEKLHGCSARYMFTEDRMWCASRTRWKKETEFSVWWRALRKAPWIEEWCRSNQGFVLYGEVFGQVQDLKYNAGKNDVFFRAFDILLPGCIWMNARDFLMELHPDHRVPSIDRGETLFNHAAIEAMANGKSMLADHVREGIVIKPMRERIDSELGRVALKLVSDEYLERA